MPGGHGREVWASQTDWANLHYCQVTLSPTGILVCVGPGLVGLQGPLWQVGTNLLFHLNYQIVKTVIPFHRLCQIHHFCGLIQVTWWRRGSSLSTWWDQSANSRDIFGLESKLVPSKVTHHLGHTRLGESIHLLGNTSLGKSICLLAASPGQPSSRGVCSWGLARGHLLQLLDLPWLLEHLMLPDCAQLPLATIQPPWDGAAQPFYVPFKYSCCGQCLVVIVPHDP